MSISLKKPDFSKPVFRIFPSAADDIKAGICPTCQKPLGEFRDSLSLREHEISGMCQACQDSIFGSANEPGEDSCKGCLSGLSLWTRLP